MKILLINPPGYKGKYCLREECCFGVSDTDLWVPGLLTNIAGMLKKEKYDYDLIDLNATPDTIIVFQPYDVVVCTIMAEHALEQDIEILKKAKESGCITIAIINDSYNDEEIIQKNSFIDLCIRNEREDMLRITLKRIKTELKKPGIISATDFPHIFYKANYNGLFLNKYNKAIIITGRGCNYNCSFCYWKRTDHRNKPIDIVYQEIKELKKYPNIREYYLLDLNLTTDRKYVIELCKKIKPLNIKWVCDGRINEVDRELLTVMKEAGCRMITYGIESANDVILTKIKKGFLIHQAMEKIYLTSTIGIIPYCCFIIGYPWDNMNTLKQTEWTINRLPKKAMVSLNFLRPLPRTDMFKQMKDLNLIKNNVKDMKRGSTADSWENHPSAPTLHLTKKELFDFRKKILQNRYRKKILKLNSLKTFLKSKNKLKLLKRMI